MSAVAALLGILAVTGFGWLVTQIIHPKATFFEQVALGYLIGFGVFTYAMFLGNLVGVAYALVPASMLLTFLSVICLLILKFQKQEVRTVFVQKWPGFSHFLSLSVFEKVVTGLIGVIFAVTIIVSSYWPVKDWDSLVLYDFRARTFVVTGFMDKGLELGYFLGYPLFTSLSHTWVYLLGFQYPGITHSLLYCSLLVLMYSALRKHAARPWALLWTLVFCFTSGLFDHALLTYTNLAYSVFLVGGYYYLFEWLREQKNADLIVSAILVGLSTWARSAEPFWIVMTVVVMGVCVVKRRWKQLLIYPAIILVIRQPWQLFEKAHAPAAAAASVPSPEAVEFIQLGFFGRLALRLTPSGIWEVLYYFWQNIVQPSLQLYIIFVLVSLILLLKIRKKQFSKINTIIFAVILVNILGVLAGIFEYSIFFREWREVGGSAQRMSLFFGPLIIFYTANVTYQLFDHIFKPKKKIKLPAKNK